MQKREHFILGFLLFFILLGHMHAQAPPGYYDGTEGIYGTELKAALHEIINDHDEPSYSDLRDYILPASDEDPLNSSNVILLYTGRSQAKSSFGSGADEWNREHVWAKSHGGFDNDPPCGTDAHMVRPTDVSVNSDRGNKDFDEGGQQHSEATGCYFTEYTWEPRDAVKGDVARMILYMDVRYEGTGGELDLSAVDMVNTSPDPEHGRLSTLLLWHEQDPPDAFEINRNNVVFSYQGNRNPFIDHPEFVANIWDPSAGINSDSRWLDAGFYPNPVNEILYVTTNTNVTQLRVSIINLLGKEMLTNIIPGSGNARLDCSSFPAGIYVLKIEENENGRTYISKFMKN